LGAPSLISSRFAHGGPRTPAVARGGDAKWTLNPAVTLIEATRGSLAQRDAAAYVAAQLAGAFAGVALAHAMYDLPLYGASTHVRAGVGQLVSEGVATFGLVFTILAVSRARPAAVPAAVGLYITAAYWFTSSSSFANPAVTLARAFTPTFAGIRAADAPAFVVAQLAGACSALGAVAWLLPETRAATASGVAPVAERIDDASVAELVPRRPS
jgi:glycerol uptake facilitator-like aquaporin